MFNGTLKIDGKEIKVSNVEAIDKGVDTYFTGTAEADVPVSKNGTLDLTNAEHAKLIIRNCVIEKGGKSFEGFGQE
ncbi:hypothetical protein Dip510_001291 [Elusimicrobium posterum]|uniref:hypothetical protein n=1 Tax=Elusimicrobium posterum TaxID=3116653 RepID=UPI003C746D88